jgi:probable F420-dependent oxidoreductase
VELDRGAALDSAVDVRGDASAAEADGFDGYWLSEVKHDPFVGLAVAAGATDRVHLGTAIALAFARNPMTTASAANDLQALFQGRFLLGLGTQVRAHITRRFSMPWSHPAPRMREYVLALRAIWDTWHTGVPLDFRGDFYAHTLMTPMFVPPEHPFGAPPVLLAGVGEAMTEVAGEVADGFLAHGFTAERYLREVTLPGRRGRRPPCRCRCSRCSSTRRGRASTPPPRATRERARSSRSSSARWWGPSPVCARPRTSRARSSPTASSGCGSWRTS